MLEITRLEKKQGETLERSLDFKPNLDGRIITSFTVQTIDLATDNTVPMTTNGGIKNNTQPVFVCTGGVAGKHYKIIITAVCHHPDSTQQNPIPDEIQIEDVFVDVVDD